MSPLSHSERFALAAVTAALAVPAWWLGASTVPGQWFGVGAGVVAAGAALVARRTAGPATEPAAGSRLATRLVVACVVAFLALLLCQALNPDRILIPDRRPVGSIHPLAHLAWLPTGIAGPFDRLPGDFLPFTDAWRHLLVAAAVLLPALAGTLLPRRPAVLRALLGLLFVHAVVFSAFAFVHSLSGSKAVLWLATDAINFQGAAQFLGKNQQAAYQILLLAAALAAWFAPSELRPWAALRHRDLWLGLGSVLVLAATVTTRSRVGLGAAGLLAVVGLMLVFRRRQRTPSRRALLLAGGLAFAGAAGLACLPPVRSTLARVAEVAREPGDILVGGAYRRILHDIAWQMTLDRPWFGHGAGCYMILFSEYHPRVPAFMEHVRRHQPRWNRIVHAYADGDWIQFTAEYGLVGTALLALPWLAWAGLLLHARPPLGAGTVLALGPTLVLAHGWIDFVLRNPAILGLAAGLALLSLAVIRQQPFASHSLSA